MARDHETEERYVYPLQTRCTRDEDEIIREAIDASGKTASRWIRETLVAEAERQLGGS